MYGGRDSRRRRPARTPPARPGLSGHIGPDVTSTGVLATDRVGNADSTAAVGELNPGRSFRVQPADRTKASAITTRIPASSSGPSRVARHGHAKYNPVSECPATTANTAAASTPPDTNTPRTATATLLAPEEPFPSPTSPPSGGSSSAAHPAS